VSPEVVTNSAQGSEIRKLRLILKYYHNRLLKTTRKITEVSARMASPL
jgi:hypothetical protein